MKRNFPIICAVLLAVTVMTMDLSAFTLGGKAMVKNGVGKRTMFFTTLYYIHLWVPQSLKGKSGKDIINADEPMAVHMKIDSSACTMEKLVKSMKGNFNRVASSGYGTSEATRQQFINLISGHEIGKGDWFFLRYVPGTGLITFIKKASGKTTRLGVVSGIPLKKALFAIWLGPKAIQGSLKRGLLGK